MSHKAKASLQAVKLFYGNVKEARNYNNSFSRGISCLEQLQKILYEEEGQINESLTQIKAAKEKLVAKIRSIEEIIARLREELNRLQNQLSDLEMKLSSTPKRITITDSNGNEHGIPNPSFVALEAEIGALRAKVSGVKNELSNNQHRLDKANNLRTRIAAHINSGTTMIQLLKDKMSRCKKMQMELHRIMVADGHAGINAEENLANIVKIIEKYKSRKMVYNNASVMETGNDFNDSRSVNINIVVDKSQTIINSVSPKEIKEHNVIFDKDGHICEYDGKKFGGIYNSYEDRIKYTSDNNPMLGQYEGDRGESKYIPSNRSAEGIVVIGILSDYGLDGIEYRNAEPDFEPCSVDVVKIDNMTENRDNYSNSSGEIQYGNFTQADIALAAKWNSEKRESRSDWKAEDVREYRWKNKLTWHEKCDMETMVLVRSEINLYFKHIGGCSECRIRDAVSDIGGGFDE